MRQEGMFSIALVFLFILVYGGNAASIDEIAESHDHTQEVLHEAEQLNRERFGVEASFDRALEFNIHKAALLGTLTSEEMRGQLSAEMTQFMEEMEGRGRWVFFLEEPGWAGGERQALSGKRVREIIQVTVHPLKGPLYRVEVRFTGGVQRNIVLKADIRGRVVHGQFEVPVSYRKVVIVAGPGNI